MSVCGDDICELEESCLTCPADCGVCPMPTSIKVAIGLPVALFCSGFILTLVVRMSVQYLTNICKSIQLADDKMGQETLKEGDH